MNMSLNRSNINHVRSRRALPKLIVYAAGFISVWWLDSPRFLNRPVRAGILFMRFRRPTPLEDEEDDASVQLLLQLAVQLTGPAGCF